MVEKEDEEEEEEGLCVGVCVCGMEEGLTAPFGEVFGD